MATTIYLVTVPTTRVHRSPPTPAADHHHITTCRSPLTAAATLLTRCGVAGPDAFPLDGLDGLDSELEALENDPTISAVSNGSLRVWGAAQFSYSLTNRSVVVLSLAIRPALTRCSLRC